MIQRPKGTYDVYGSLAKKQDYVKRMFGAVCESYNFGYIETPMFERSELFHRGVGETTDIVTKETYDFQDKGGRDITLRPEGTASVARCIIEDKLYTTLPLKFYYIGQMFRYERPQKGRYRELRQMGVELYGSTEPVSDAEVISLGKNFLDELGIETKVIINYLGGVETRKKFREALIKHFESDIDNFCEDCKERLYKNPLRVLDCKVDADKELMKDAPSILDFLTEEESENFVKIQEYLKYLNIEYEVNTRLVRGLDYYNNIVFEYKTLDDEFGSVGGGGRYDNLSESLDGPSIPSVGFAFGLDRLVDVMNRDNIEVADNNIDLYIMNVTENELMYSYNLAQDLRMCGFKVDIDLLNKSMKAKFKEVDRLNPKYLIIIGEEEVKSGVLTVKDNLTKEEQKIESTELLDFLNVNL